MADELTITGLSDEDLKTAYQQSGLSDISDADLARAYQKTQPNPYASGVQWDEYSKNVPLGRILDAFGHGAAEGWGTDAHGIMPETERLMREAGIWNDVKDDQQSLIKAYNEAYMRPAAAAVDVAMRGFSSLFRGSMDALVQAGRELPRPSLGEAGVGTGGFGGYLRESASSLLDPQLATRDVTGRAEELVSKGGEMHARVPVPAPPAVPPSPFAPGAIGFSTTIAADLNAAREFKIIGAGEAGWKGTEPYGTATGEAAPRRPAAPVPEPEPLPSHELPEVTVTAPTELPPPADIHQAARDVAPDVFAEYDGLKNQTDLLRERVDAETRQLRASAEAQAPGAAEIADLQARMETATPRLAKKYQARLDDLIPARDAFLEDQFTMGALTRDNETLTRLREQIQEADHRMRDLAPQVSAAYRAAAAQHPDLARTEGAAVAEAAPAAEPVAERPVAAAEPVAEAAAPAEPPAVTPEPAAPPDITPTHTDTTAAAAPAAPIEAPAANWIWRSADHDFPVTPTGEEVTHTDGRVYAKVRQPDGTESYVPKDELVQQGAAPAAPPFDIAADAAANLIAAGRPAEEAHAAAALIAAHYEARAARFKGAKGTGADLYRAEAPAIRGVAQPDLTPTPAPPHQPAPLIPTETKPNLPTGGGIETLDPTTIGVDASRFQFKAGGDAAGVTERLEGVQRWDPRMAGTVMVWRDEAGKDWIVDGHQRLALAQRMTAAGQTDIKMNAFVLDVGKGVSAEEARVIAAAKNISEGTGTSIDAAKVIQWAKEADIEMPAMPPRSTLVREGQALARLGPEAFGMAVNEVVPTNQAALVGRILTDPVQQVEAMRVLSKAKPDNLRQAEIMVREVGETAQEMTKQGGLFGPETFASSLVLERAQIIDEAMKQLARDRTTFRTLVGEAERIESAGANVLDPATNVARLTADEQATQFLTQLATRKGPVSDALSDAARQLQSGGISRAGAAQSFLGLVRRAVAEGVDQGPDAGRAVAGAVGELNQPEGETFLQRRVPKPPASGAPLFGEAETPATPPKTAEPTVRTDARQVDMFGTADAAVQAQAARDAQGGLTGKGAQAKPDEGLFAPKQEEGTTLFQSRDYDPGQVPLYSAVARATDDLKQAKGTGAQMLAMLQKTPGVKAEELKWLGLDDWLRGQASVTKEQIAEYVRANALDVREVVKGGEGLSDDELAHNMFGVPYNELSVDERTRVDRVPPGGDAKFGQYQLPGGSNYKEVLITLPPKASAGLEAAKREHSAAVAALKQFSAENAAHGPQYDVALDRYLEASRIMSRFEDEIKQQPQYQSGHWDEPNVVAHLRMSDRVDADGKKTLLVEEVQSDWHQKGRKEGYRGADEPKGLSGAESDEFRRLNTMPDAARTPEQNARLNELYALGDRRLKGVPDAPFKTTWPQMVMRRALQYAVDNGYERISWTPGDVQAARYDLSKHVNSIGYAKRGDLFNVTVWDKNDKQILNNQSASQQWLADNLGKEIADKIIEGTGRQDGAHTYLEDLDLKVGGEGMKAFYDKMLPNEVQKIVGKFGAKVGRSTIETGLTEGSGARDAVWHRAMSDRLLEAAETAEREGANQGVIRSLTNAAERLDDPASDSYALLHGITEPARAYLDRVGGIVDSTPRPQSVHSVEITPRLRDAVAQEGLPLFQEARGKININSARSIITLMKDANASTFLHETGHAWLEELLSDARDPRAPADLLADAQTVRTWLGAEPDAPMTRRQHEKFARGFERYLMEGVAPSPGLARVFAQFKQWLTAIYQRVQALRAPLTDEMRHVFDRLLATTPERTVIAPEDIVSHETPREPPSPEAGARVAGDLAGLHETDATHTAPEEAAAAADQIRDERSRTIEDHTPEVADELGTRRPGDGGGGTASGGAAGDGRAQGDASAAGADAARPGAVGGGGGGAAAEGPTSTGHSDVPGGPHDLFGPRESPLVDKAGNIRLDNLNQPESVNQAIREAADANEDFIAARRGVISDAEVLNLADALGMKASDINQRKLGEAFNAEQVMAARKLLIESATTVRDAMTRAATGTDADVLAYAEAKSRHQMIQEQVAGITAEAGRALRAFRGINKESVETGQLGMFLQSVKSGLTLNQLRREAQLGMKLETPQQVSKFLRDAAKPGFSDMALELWINALLSGPQTHATNMVSNLLVSLYTIPETALAGAIGAGREALFGSEMSRPPVTGPEHPAHLDPTHGAGPQGTLGVPHTPTVGPPAPPVVPTPVKSIERVYLHEALDRLFGIVQGAQDGIRAGWALWKDEANTPTGQKVEQRRFQAIPSATVNVLGREMEIGGKQLRIPGRLLGVEDEIFKGIGYRQELNATAARQGRREGLSGEALAARVADLTMNPPDTMIEAAQKAAVYQTFNQELGAAGRLVQQFANTHWWAKLVIPFVRTPANIVKFAAERSPFGLFSAEVRNNLMGSNGAVARDTQIARMALGTAVGVTAVSLAARGLITGGGPTDANERAMLYLSGWQPYSIKIGSTYYSYARLEPLGTLLGVGADMAEVSHAASEKEETHLASRIFASVTKNLTDKTFLRGISDLVQAVSDPDRYGVAYIKGLAGTAIPTGLAQIARTQDPFIREARSVLDGIKSRIPGQSETLFPRRDIWGEPIARQGGLGPDLLSPVAESKMSADPINQALLRLKIFPAKVEREIRGVKLTDAQYDDFAAKAGRMAKLRLNALIGPGFSSLPEEAQKRGIHDMIDSAREMARDLVMLKSIGSDNDILKQSLDAKRKLLVK